MAERYVFMLWCGSCKRLSFEVSEHSTPSLCSNTPFKAATSIQCGGKVATLKTTRVQYGSEEAGAAVMETARCVASINRSISNAEMRQGAAPPTSDPPRNEDPDIPVGTVVNPMIVFASKEDLGMLRYMMDVRKEGAFFTSWTVEGQNATLVFPQARRGCAWVRRGNLFRYESIETA